MSSRSDGEFFDWLDYHAKYNPDVTAAIDLGTDRHWTYWQFNDRATRLASSLSSRFGIASGDRVSILGQNSTDFFELMFACWKLGAVFMPLSWRLTAFELEQITSHGEPRVIFVDDEFSRLVEQLSIVRVVRRPGSKECDYERLIQTGRADVTMGPVALDDVSTLLYTSGTTGRPKGVIGTFRMTMNIVLQAALHAEVGRESRTLTYAPLFHSAGLNGAAMPLFHFGASIVVMRRWDANEVLKHLMNPDMRITHCIGVPTNYSLMSELAEFESASFPTLRVLGVGSAPVSIDLLQTWARKGLSLSQSFGMTEVFGVSFTPPHRAREKLGSAGFPLMHVHVRIGDADGKELPRGTVGEIQIRGPGVTPGYWKDQELTKAAFIDGWFRSGDAARMERDGTLYIIDRIKDMIISGGENIYPSEIEHLISEIPEVSQVAVIGIPSQKWGEIGMAIILLRAGRTLTADQVVDCCSAKLARYKIPKKIAFVDNLPLSPQGKILKRELRVQYGDMGKTES
jgi:fatty-acyl-CoA synthase